MFLSRPLVKQFGRSLADLDRVFSLAQSGNKGATSLVFTDSCDPEVGLIRLFPKSFTRVIPGNQAADKGYILGSSEVLRELTTNPRETAFR